MRYCLSCRRLSANTPICTCCGKSFGGCLCGNKKCRFLNPDHSLVCGQCGSTTLLEATHGPNLSGCLRLFLWMAVLLALIWWAPRLLAWVLHLFQSWTEGSNLLCWLLNGSVNLLAIVLAFYILSALLPGEAGQMFRGLMNRFFHNLLKLFFALLHTVLQKLFQILLKTVATPKK